MKLEPPRVWPAHADFLSDAIAAGAVYSCSTHPYQLLRYQGTEAASHAYKAIKQRYKPSFVGDEVALMDDMDDVIRLYPVDCPRCVLKAK